MATYFFAFSIVGFLVISLISLVCFAMGLLALCEYAENKPNFLKKLLKKFIIVIAAVHVGFIVFECLSLWRIVFSILVLALNYRLHQDLPKLTFIPCISNFGAVVLNHLIWISYFFRNYHPILEVFSFYFFMVWSVPLFIVISYSTTEVLPNFYEEASYKSQKRNY